MTGSGPTAATGRPDEPRVGWRLPAPATLAQRAAGVAGVHDKHAGEMVFDRECRVANDPHGEERRALAAIRAKNHVRSND